MRIARNSTVFFYATMAFIVGGGTAVIGFYNPPLGSWLGIPVAGLVLWMGLRPALRRWRVSRQPLAPDSRRWLEDHVSLFKRLDENGRKQFEQDVKFVLDEWRYEGVRGVEVTTELRLGVAAGVALLVHGRPDWELSPARTVLFYPEAFDDAYEGGDFAEYDGMAHAQGPIILSRQAVEESWARQGDGSNVVLHELAHLFDFANSFADGIPSLLDPASIQAWDELARREMRRALVGRSMLRRYAATNTAEFFAVAVENFFDRPEQLAKSHHRLFNALVALFNLDPRSVVDPVADSEATTNA